MLTSPRHLTNFTLVFALGLALLPLVCSELHAQSTLNPPVDGVFDWKDRARTLKIVIDNTDQKDGDGKVIVPGAEKFHVAPCPPDGSDVIKTGVCKPLRKNQQYDCPYVEGNPGKNCPAFTMGAAVRRAVASWNAAATGWTLDPNAKDVPVITVRMSTAANGLIEEELIPITPVLPLGDNGSIPNYVPRIDNSRPDPDEIKATGIDAAKNVLALFHCLDKPDKLGVVKACSKAEIVFNRNVNWGISKLNDNYGDKFYDPIVVALHEFGHALRLDHDSPGLVLRLDVNAKLVIILRGIADGQVNKVDGIIMRAGLDPGVHNINPTDPNDLTKDFARNPLGPAKGGKANTDTNSAAASAVAPIQK